MSSDKIENKAKFFRFFKGRIALYAILKSMGVGEGDEVIVPGFTCVVVPNAVSYLGAKPIYVDIDRKNYNIDVSQLQAVITPRTKVILAQHTFGIPAEMDKILSLAKNHGLYVIEDSCHAMGSKYKDREVGKIGDAAFFSSQWSKPLTTGLGGWAVVNNTEIAGRMIDEYSDYNEPPVQKVLLLRLQYLMYSALYKPGMFWTLQALYRKLSDLGLAIGSSDSEELEYKMPHNFKLKMSCWQLDLLTEKLKKIDKIIEHRKNNVSILEEQLIKKGMEIVDLPQYIDPVFLRYPLMVADKEMILRKAKQSGIELGDWFLSPVHPNLSGWEKVSYNKGMCPEAEDVCRHIINLPVHERVTPTDINNIVDLICSVN